ncbi:hypothetical protein [Anaeromassilibacillus sp. Marseille-P3371]|nr:hypothetical protein [Anaeromassilibacillus sp. Marseille-P3371]
MYGNFQKEAKDCRPKGAVRPPCQSTGVYTTLPGQNAKLHCTVTIV